MVVPANHLETEDRPTYHQINYKVWIVADSQLNRNRWHGETYQGINSSQVTAFLQVREDSISDDRSSFPPFEFDFATAGQSARSGCSDRRRTPSAIRVDGRRHHSTGHRSGHSRVLSVSVANRLKEKSFLLSDLHMWLRWDGRWLAIDTKLQYVWQYLKTIDRQIGLLLRSQQTPEKWREFKGRGIQTGKSRDYRCAQDWRRHRCGAQMCSLISTAQVRQVYIT